MNNFYYTVNQNFMHDRCRWVCACVREGIQFICIKKQTKRNNNEKSIKKKKIV